MESQRAGQSPAPLAAQPQNTRVDFAAQTPRPGQGTARLAEEWDKIKVPHAPLRLLSRVANMNSSLRGLSIVLVLWIGLAALTDGSAAPASPATAPTTMTTHPTTGPVNFLPGLRINFKEGTIDLEGKVVLREGEWLELLACAPGTKEHEAVFSVKAKPSSIHAALLALGQEPGSPMLSKWEGEGAQGHAGQRPTRGGERLVGGPR